MPDTIQTIIFEKGTLPVSEQIKFLKKNGFSTEVDIKKNGSRRYRQENPSLFKKGTFKSTVIANGAVIVSGVTKY